MKENHRYTGQNKNIYQNLIVNLIYPAILGSIIYSLFDIILTSIIKGAIGFLAGTTFFVMIKSLLILGIIGFYCCDYLYSLFTTHFKIQYFYFDIIILFGVALTFKAINIDTQQSPNLDFICIAFFSFMFLYFLWDFFEIGNKEGRSTNNAGEADFYKRMVKWEIFSTITFLSIYLAYKLSLINYSISIVFVTTAILVTTFIFGNLIKQKRLLINP